MTSGWPMGNPTAERWPDPAKAYKFRTQIVSAASVLEIGFMFVDGLRYSPNVGQLQLTRGVCKDHDELFNWVTRPAVRDIIIVVDEQITFKAKNCAPKSLHFNGLDAGGSGGHLLVETLTVEYATMYPEYNAPYL
jgi:hypothetical protein